MKEKSKEMNRKERTEQKMQELFCSCAAGDEGSDGGYMQIPQGYIFRNVCCAGSLGSAMRELVTVTALSTLSFCRTEFTPDER